MKKKLVLYALILSVFMPASNVFAGYQANMTVEQDENRKYDFVVDFFVSTGVLDVDFAKMYEPEQPISKGIINEALSRLTSFPINCKSEGQYVTLKDVVIEIVGAYSGFVTKNNSSDTIIKEAQRLGIMKSLKSVALDKEITAKVFVQLLYNTAYAEVYYYDDLYGDSYMERNGYREITGIVRANEYTSLYSKEGVGRDRIEIGTDRYTLENSADLLGYEVRAVVDENDGVIAYMMTEKNSVVTVMSDQVEKNSDAYFYYYEGNKSKKLKLYSEYAGIYNGVLRYRKDSELLHPELGVMTFIDNDGDGAYDVLKTESYKVMKIDSIDRENEVLVDGKTGTRIELDGIDFDLYIDGDEASIYDVPKNAVLYYAYSDTQNYLILHVSTVKKEGTVDSTNANGSDSTVTIDGVVYPSSESIAGEISVGSYVRVFFGSFGRAEYIEYLKGYHYGILKSIYADESADDRYMIKYLDESGEILTSEISEKCRVYSNSLQGAKFSDAVYAEIRGYIDKAYAPKPSGDVYGYGMAAPIFMYKKANDTISIISLPQIYDENDIGAAKKPYILRSAAVNPNMLYKSSENLFRTGTKAFYATYRNANYCDNINKFTNGDTIVFDLMINSDNSVDVNKLDNAIIRKASDLTMDPWTYGSFYNLNEGNVAEAMVLYNLRQKSAVDGFIIVSKSVSSVIPDTGDTGYKITGFKGKTPVEYYMNEDTVLKMKMTGLVGDTLDLKPADIGCGDYMKISLGNNGTIVYANVYARGEYSKSDYNLYHDSSNIESPEEKMFGQVKRMSGGVMTLYFDNNAINNEMKTYSYNTYRNSVVYIYDGNNVSVGDPSDICVGDYIYTRLNESNAQETIIWRKN